VHGDDEALTGRHGQFRGLEPVVADRQLEPRLVGAQHRAAADHCQ
jgi:hypothetical protein